MKGSPNLLKLLTQPLNLLPQLILLLRLIPNLVHQMLAFSASGAQCQWDNRSDEAGGDETYGGCLRFFFPGMAHSCPPFMHRRQVLGSVVDSHRTFSDRQRTHAARCTLKQDKVNIGQSCKTNDLYECRKFKHTASASRPGPIVRSHFHLRTVRTPVRVR